VAEKILGIDVGGTHTDAALLSGSKVLATAKVSTNRGRLLDSLVDVTRQVIEGVDIDSIDSINLSTTLSTNAIVEGRTEPVGLVISSGPGLNPDVYRMGDHYFIVSGSIDHRGSSIADLDEGELDHAVQTCGEKDVRVYALVSKFSTRNPDHEKRMANVFQNQSDFITMGHELSGQLSFPRRIATAYYNSAVWRDYNSFADAMEESLRSFGITADIHILKADGGTMPLEVSRRLPVESILSGPAASVMGIVGLSKITEDSIILDIGGTTTDIAVFADGAPLVVRDGITIRKYPTLVRALNTRSIGIGGDSALSVVEGKVRVGPDRLGPAMALSGDHPTLVDAMNYMNIMEHGDSTMSRQGIEDLAGKIGMKAADLASGAVEYALSEIHREAFSMVADINNKPVYTIHEMLEGKVILPKKVYAVGGPAEVMRSLLEERFGLEVHVPPNHHVANAIGAALARTTFDIELFADTAKGTLIVPNLNFQREVDRHYSLEQAEEEARFLLAEHIHRIGSSVSDENIDIIEASSFNMVGGFFSRGKDIRVKCQVRPGVTTVVEVT
jgi:N-methylhydantoinase A/oxoprolinase/acetone carboxylase beta subunit